MKLAPRVDSREERGTPRSLLPPPKKLFKGGTAHNIPFISEKSSSAACFANIRGLNGGVGLTVDS